MTAAVKRSRTWSREQWLVALVLGGLALLALALLVVDSARHPPEGESRLGPLNSAHPSPP